MRLPVEALQPQLGPILEGVLLWAADSKNKFKLKVRGPAASSRTLCYA
jgi:ribosomal RNA-processing protein 12